MNDYCATGKVLQYIIIIISNRRRFKGMRH